MRSMCAKGSGSVGIECIPGQAVEKEVIRMSRQEVKEMEVNIKLAELRDLIEQRIEVDKSIEDLKESYGKLTIKIIEVKGEIRLLGGNVPAGNGHAGGGMLWHLKEGRRLSDERP